MTLDENLRALIKKLYVKFCFRFPSENEIQLWIERINTKEFRIDELAQHFENSPEYVEQEIWKKDLLIMSEKLINSLTIEPKKKSLINKLPEPNLIILSVFNEETNHSTIYSLENDQLIPIFSKSGSLFLGMCYYKKEKILLVANKHTKNNSQIFGFKLIEKSFLVISGFPWIMQYHYVRSMEPLDIKRF